ncbi:MAG: methionine synthase [Syntrophaceae bacterium]|nr:methionine synthase [Syntrophaceae bacterium]
MTIKPFLPIGIGSLPYRDPFKASEVILKYFPDSPYWPQLPSRDLREGMLAQFTEGMPGVTMDGEKVYFRSPFNPAPEWEEYYEASSEAHIDHFIMGREYASGFYALLELLKGRRPLLVKGQITGPITFGLGVSDEKKIPILYEPNLKEMLLKTIASKARWQEMRLSEVAPEAETLIFFDEPLLSGYGSISMNLSKEEIIDCLNRVISALHGLSGIHICGATDWSMIMETGIKVIHFDAYQFFSNMLAYASELKPFLLNGGILAWGIIPSEEEFLRRETASNLMKSLEEKMRLLVREGIPEEILMKNSLVSQSCGLASLSEDLAEKALKLTKELSQIRPRGS